MFLFFFLQVTQWNSTRPILNHTLWLSELEDIRCVKDIYLAWWYAGSKLYWWRKVKIATTIIKIDRCLIKINNIFLCYDILFSNLELRKKTKQNSPGNNWTYTGPRGAESWRQTIIARAKCKQKTVVANVLQNGNL